MMKSEGLRMLGWIIPIVCMTVAAWVLYGQNEAFSEASFKRNQANREVEEAQKEKDLYKLLPMEHRYASVPDVALEETAFLNYLRTRCAANGVRFDKYQTQTITYGKDKQATPPDPKNATLLKGIRKISSTITFVGEYGSVRKLLGELESSDRLYTLTNVAWALAEHGTTLTMTISRYVEPPNPADAAAAAKAALPAAPGKVAPGKKSTSKLPGGAATPLNSLAPAKPGTSPNTVPLSNPAGQANPAHPTKSPPTIKMSTVSPGVTSKP